jgi:hypothetical protein
VSQRTLMPPRCTTPDYLVIETASTIVQWAMVAQLTVLSVQPRDLSGRVNSADEDPIAAR